MESFGSSCAMTGSAGAASDSTGMGFCCGIVSAMMVVCGKITLSVADVRTLVVEIFRDIAWFAKYTVGIIARLMLGTRGSATASISMRSQYRMSSHSSMSNKNDYNVFATRKK